MDKYRFRLPFSTPIFCQSRRFAAYHEQGQAPAPHAGKYFKIINHPARARRVGNSLPTLFDNNNMSSRVCGFATHTTPKLGWVRVAAGRLVAMIREFRYTSGRVSSFIIHTKGGYLKSSS